MWSHVGSPPRQQGKLHRINRKMTALNSASGQALNAQGGRRAAARRRALLPTSLPMPRWPAVMCRSPHAHARFRHADLARVRAMRAWLLFLTGADITDLGPLPTPAFLPRCGIKVPHYRFFASISSGCRRAFASLLPTLSIRPRTPPRRLRSMATAARMVIVFAGLRLAPRSPHVWRDHPAILPFETGAGDAQATKAASRRPHARFEVTIVNQRLVTNYLIPVALSPKYYWSAIRCTVQPGHPYHPRHLCGGCAQLRFDKCGWYARCRGGFGTKLVSLSRICAAAVSAEKLPSRKMICAAASTSSGDSHGRIIVPPRGWRVMTKGRFLALELVCRRHGRLFVVFGLHSSVLGVAWGDRRL